MTRARTCLFGLVLAFAGLAAPRPAGACKIASFQRGLHVGDNLAQAVLAADGVIAFDAYVRGESIESGLARFTMTLTPDAGGPAITGTVEHQPLGSDLLDYTDDLHQIVLVWRPDVALAPGDYTAAAHIERPEAGPEEWTVPITVTDVSGPPLSPPLVALAAPAAFVVEELDRVCCETPEDSCGDHTVCYPTRVRTVPGLQIDATVAPADTERAYVWVAPWDGQAAGAPYPRIDAWAYGPGMNPFFSAWSRYLDLRLPDAAGTICVVVGATSLIDGSTAVGAPICVDLVAAHEEPGITDWPTDEQCLSEPIYEDDGRPFHDTASGCRLAASPPGLALLALLLLRRRRRPLTTSSARSDRAA